MQNTKNIKSSKDVKSEKIPVKQRCMYCGSDMNGEKVCSICGKESKTYEAEENINIQYCMDTPYEKLKNLADYHNYDDRDNCGGYEDDYDYHDENHEKNSEEIPEGYGPLLRFILIIAAVILTAWTLNLYL